MGLSFLELVELFSGVVKSQPPTMLVLEPFGKGGQVQPPFVPGLGLPGGSCKVLCNWWPLCWVRNAWEHYAVNEGQLPPGPSLDPFVGTTM